ncbi:LysR family transcriptional regulator [Epibacterium ulvae]|uniref:LysR substrate-binding domain-containing protein n=1 Tax=Epibacterium ulvae TaxID=1156985 RepID=UPI001BFC25D6|nr:LysR substrate-binding domain-containing protein [Epibacterium ulvae]MBT8155542.1 LysR family transcriptional regulator [Epibacterium ulvae]
MSHLPPLTALPAFEATARLGSVTAAASELGRTHGAVSKQIKHLAEDLGGDLFRKSGTGLVLTERGARLQEALSPMLRRLGELATELRRGSEQQVLRIAVGATFATRWLTPRLPRFYATHPEVEITLLMSGLVAGQPRYSGQDFDILLSYDRLRGPVGPGFHTVVMGDAAYGPVCAPNYPFEPNAAGGQVAMRFSHAGGPSAWAAWEEISGRQIHSPEMREHPHHILALEAAAAGMGMALTERRLVAQDLEQGRLIAPLGFVHGKDGFLAALPNHRPAPQAAELFLDWLRQEARA